MRSKYKTLVGVLGVMCVAGLARVASAGGWGLFVNNGNLGSCDSPTGLVDDNNDAFLDTYSLWMPHTSGHNDQIRGQALDTNGNVFCTTGFFSDGQSVEVQCSVNIGQYRCQTNRLN